MLDDLFAPDTLTAARDVVLRPPPVPKQAASFSAWKTTTAAPRGVAAGAAQSGGFFADVLGAFGQASAASYTGDMLGNMTPQQRRETDAAGERLRTQGLDFGSEAGDLFRGVARDYAPDAATAHTSERLIFDASRVITKAVGYSVVTGNPFAGAALTGADEGMTTADDLKQQGVDLATRTKVGAIVGGVTGIGVALPMAGNTLAQTAGLVAVGGPGSFIAQQAAVREVLSSAGYDQLSEQYDPFDPVGLLVSTLVPTAFGAYGLRAAKARSAQAAVVAEQQAAREFAQGPVPSAETPTAAAARAAFSPEQVDAARVLLSVEQRAKANPGAVDDLRAQQAHDSALVRAEEQIAAGERVSVADVAPLSRDTTMAMPARYDASGESLSSLPDAGNSANAEQVPMVELFHGSPEQAVSVRDSGIFGGVFASPSRESASSHGDYLLATRLPESAIMRQSDFENVSDADLKKVAPWVKDDDLERLRELVIDDMQADDADAAILKVDDAAEASWEAQRLRGAIAKNAGFRAAEMNDEHGTSYLLLPGVELKSASQNESSSPSPLGEFSARIAEAASLVKAEIEAQQNARDSAARPAAEATTQPQAADAASPAAPRQAEAGAPAAGSATAKAGLVDDGAAMRVAELEAAQPDMLVQLDGMDAPVRLSDLMATVKAEADEMVQDGQLFEVAAACALQMGA